MNSHDQSVRAVAVPRNALTCSEEAEMFALLIRNFEGPTMKQFQKDLAEKETAILLRRGNALVGFSTLAFYRAATKGELIDVVYSGDTIVAQEAWGTTALPRAWIQAVLARKKQSGSRMFWLLLTSGYRTYRFLSVFWKNFYPAPGQSNGSRARGLRDRLARERFGALFDAEAGIVRFDSPQRLRPHLACVAPSREMNAHVRLFLELNPGHSEGDELVCLTEIAEENLTLAGRRMVRGRSHEHGVLSL